MTAGKGPGADDGCPAELSHSTLEDNETDSPGLRRL